MSLFSRLKVSPRIKGKGDTFNLKIGDRLPYKIANGTKFPKNLDDFITTKLIKVLTVNKTAVLFLSGYFV